MASSGASNTDSVQQSITSDTSVLKRKSNDIGWEFALLVDPNQLDKVKCILCNKVMSGGVYRLKEHVGHISGNVSACPKASAKDTEKCKNAIMETRAKKKGKRLEDETSRSQVNIPQSCMNDELEELGVRKGPRLMVGGMDKFVTQINPESTINSSKQQSMKDALGKERTLAVHRYCAKWVYEAGIPFNAIDNESFRLFVEGVGQFGPGYIPPSQYMLREPLLKGEVECTRTSLKKQEEEWALNGCSIMTDAWSDRKRRSIMNLCINCRLYTSLLS